MKYCRHCLTTNLRPNASFSEAGICVACQYSLGVAMQAEPQTKLALLQEKIRETRARLGKRGSYDCIVGVSGGKDSTRQAHWVRDRLGLRPLLVCCGYPPLQMTSVGAENLSNLITMGFDLIVATPAPQTSAALSLASFRQFGNVCKSTEIALFSTVPRLAIDLGVNMIFWGENPALQVGDSAVEGVDEFDGNNLRRLNTLTAGGIDWIRNALSSPHLLDHYLYPDEIRFERKKISIFYLGPAWDDWSMMNNATYAALQGLTLRPGDEERTGDISNASMLDEEFTNINMMIKYFKFGFGRTTDLLCEMIRAGAITRDNAIPVVEKYDGVCSDEIIGRYCAYVGIGPEEFWDEVNRWVNPQLFTIGKNRRPQKKFRVGYDYEG
jgi:N-acetyl sugar amidotransferase